MRTKEGSAGRTVLRCVLTLLPLVLGGCLWLAVPSAGYQGYQYMNSSKSGPQSASPKADSSQQSAKPASQAKQAPLPVE